LFFYFLIRFQNLNSVPVFGDEAIYVRWSQIIKNEETLRFIPQTDGKQPLFMWFTAVAIRFISDPLAAGRIISIISGSLIMLAVFLITCLVVDFNFPARDPIKFIKESIRDNFYYGFLSLIIYTLLPFSFFFDRLAVPDNTLSLFGAWSLFFSLLLAKFRRLDLSLILGMVLGLSWLTKSPAIYFVVLSIFTYLIFNLKHLKTTYLPVLSAALAFVIYNILRLVSFSPASNKQTCIKMFPFEF
jgi:4-amino-4-deoxy-L-arabinose transferase-like glycosyltransferase